MLFFLIWTCCSLLLVADRIALWAIIKISLITECFGGVKTQPRTSDCLSDVHNNWPLSGYMLVSSRASALQFAASLVTACVQHRIVHASFFKVQPLIITQARACVTLTVLVVCLWVTKCDTQQGQKVKRLIFSLSWTLGPDRTAKTLLVSREFNLWLKQTLFFRPLCSVATVIHGSLQRR